MPPSRHCAPYCVLRDRLGDPPRLDSLHRQSVSAWRPERVIKCLQFGRKYLIPAPVPVHINRHRVGFEFQRIAARIAIDEESRRQRSERVDYLGPGLILHAVPSLAVNFAVAILLRGMMRGLLSVPE